MNEIEKMYENAGVNKECEKNYIYRECPHKTRQCEDCVLFIYPPFTAEKQLNLIKWLVCTGKEIRISGHRKGDLFWMSTDVDNKEQESTFEETLVKLINNIWQDLTEEEKEVVRGILRA